MIGAVSAETGGIEMERRGVTDRRAPWAVFLVALGGAWSVGNVGAVVDQLSTEFDISLAIVGLLSGTVLLGFSIPGVTLAPKIAEHIGIVRTMIVAVVLGAAGNAVFAASPVFAGLVAGRAVTGFASAWRSWQGRCSPTRPGGVTRVALFGAAIQPGAAGGLGLGAVLADVGVDWRVTFAVSAVVALTPLPFLIKRDDSASSGAAEGGSSGSPSGTSPCGGSRRSSWRSSRCR